MDRWITSELQSLVANVTESMDEFDSADAGRRIEEFVELLSNWYVRRSRRRFWKSENDQDKLSAHNTLYTCLVTLAKLLAPLAPFISEEMYQNLVRSTNPDAPEGVHLADYPVSDPSLIDERLSQATRLAMKVSSLGRSARSKAGVKVRQPLSRVLVKLGSREDGELLEQVSAQIVDELNVKEVALIDREEDVLDFRARLNMALAGSRFGAEVQRVSEALSGGDQVAIALRVRGGSSVEVDGYELQPEEITIDTSDRAGFSSAVEPNLIVAVSTELTEELAQEGVARELVHRIQNMRRSAGFDIADRIVTYYSGGEGLAEMVASFSDYIRHETLSEELTEGAAPDGAYTESQSMDGAEATLGVMRVQKSK